MATSGIVEQPAFVRFAAKLAALSGGAACAFLTHSPLQFIISELLTVGGGFLAANAAFTYLTGQPEFQSEQARLAQLRYGIAEDQIVVTQDGHIIEGAIREPSYMGDESYGSPAESGDWWNSKEAHG